MTPSYFQRVKRVFCWVVGLVVCCVCVGCFFFLAPNDAPSPSESSRRPQPARPELTQQRAGSPLPQPALRSSKRHPRPNHKRQPFFQSLCTKPLSSHPPPLTATTTKKYRHLQPFLPLSSCKNTLFLQHSLSASFPAC